MRSYAARARKSCLGFRLVNPRRAREFGLSNQLPQLSFNQAIEAFHLLSPHCRFVKTLPLGASVLDLGAGDGGLLAYRLWPGIARADLRIFAWAGEKDAGFENYDGYEVGRWPEQPPNFGGTKFDAIVSVNFLEHIDEPIRFVE
jgi:SAM-dependent methyltransferase